MKHASAQTLTALEPLLIKLRELPTLKEKSTGCFYRRGKAFLHFHEDPAGLFADVRLTASGFTRFAVNTPAAQCALIDQLTSILLKD